MDAAKLWDGILPPEVPSFFSHLGQLIPDEDFRADDQAVDEVAQALSVEPSSGESVGDF